MGSDCIGQNCRLSRPDASRVACEVKPSESRLAMPRTHANLPRLFVSASLAAGASVPLDKGQANYLINVLRLRKGSQVVAFNGRDGAWLTAILSASRKAAELVPVEMVAPQTEPADLWFVFAPIKSARLDYLVQKATEMGAAHLQPVMTRHTQVGRLRLDRMKANVIEAAEQCEVLSIPQVHEPVPLERLLEEWPTRHVGRRLVFADESAPASSPLDALKGATGDPLALLIGPEGGFSDQERALLLAARFVVPISLGPRILRADTAAVAALAAIQASIGDWR